jgi:enoyl-CoA hydratase/carnithine racemase
VNELKREGDVFVLRLDAGENRFVADTIQFWNEALDEVEAAEGPKALVTTGTGKFYSNGLDLDYMKTVDSSEYLQKVLAIMGRVLTFSCTTAVAANGHAFGAGGQILLCHDYRFMRTERGYFCMPEIDIKAPLHPGMTAIIQARVPIPAAHELIVTGTRYGAELALEKGIVDAIAPEGEVLAAAIAQVAPLAGKAHPAMGQLKKGMYLEVLQALQRDLTAL